MRGDSLKERILRVATIEEVVAAYVPLQRSGAGYVGLCPLRRRRRLVRFRAEDRGMFVYGSDGKAGETVFD